MPDRSRTAGHCLHETAAEAAGKIIYDQPAERQDFYDLHRPHGTLGGNAPYERLGEKHHRDDPE